MSVRITCINKDGGYHENPYVAISHLGWINPNTGSSGKVTRLEMYDFVIKGEYAYVESGGYKAQLIAEISARGTKYVKTKADSVTSDNLLSLLECV